MKFEGSANDKDNPNLYLFTIKTDCGGTGYQGHTVRMLPKHTGLVHPFRPSYIKWA
jgi:starch phosphorylase